MKKILFRIEKELVFLLCGLIPSKSARKKFRTDPLGYGHLIFNLLYKNDKNKKFNHELAIACIAKNEGLYIAEWIEYHLLVGVSCFYFYDNESTDNTKEVLEPYIKAGIVKYTYISGHGVQKKVYETAIQTYKKDSRWIALIDLDEFLVSKTHKNVVDFLNTKQNYAQITAFWYTFGDSGHKKQTNEPVIQRFNHHEKTPSGYKSIVNPRTVKWVLNHSHSCFGKTLLVENTNDLCIFHYAIKTIEEFAKKNNRGSAWKGTNIRFKNYKEKFKELNHNEIEDNTLQKYIYNVKEAIKCRKNYKKS